MKSGFVGIVGRPNVGKSTLLNRLVGQKLAGVSAKPQTTRGVIRGIITRLEGQIILLDTPGHHRPHDALGKWMVAEIEKSLTSVELLYWMILPERLSPEEEKLLELIRPLEIPVFLLINQVDRFPKPRVLPVIEEFRRQFAFREIIPISAKTGDQVPLLVEKTIEYLPEGPMLYPEDQISDQQERMFVQEMIREKIFRLTDREVPYASSVTIESFKERNDSLMDIEATITVEKPSQKAIVIGNKGQKLKQIGTEARYEIEKFVGRKVFLRLWVKTLPDWKDKESYLRRLGYQ